MKKTPIVDTKEEAEKLLSEDRDARVIIRTDEPFWILVSNHMPWQRVPAPKDYAAEAAEQEEGD